jgi:hypothetical protein
MQNKDNTAAHLWANLDDDEQALISDNPDWQEYFASIVEKTKDGQDVRTSVTEIHEATGNSGRSR